MRSCPDILTLILESDELFCMDIGLSLFEANSMSYAWRTCASLITNYYPSYLPDFDPNSIFQAFFGGPGFGGFSYGGPGGKCSVKPSRTCVVTQRLSL